MILDGKEHEAMRILLKDGFVGLLDFLDLGLHRRLDGSGRGLFDGFRREDGHGLE